MVEKTIEVAVNFLYEGKDAPEYVNAAAQTGDMSWFLFYLFASLAMISLSIFCLRKLLCANDKGRHAFVGFSRSLGFVNNNFSERLFYKVLIAIFSMGFLVCFTLSMFNVANAKTSTFSAVTEDGFEYSNVINAYVNEDTGEIKFDEGYIKNSNPQDIFKINKFSASKFDGVDDGSCNWKIDLGDINLLNASLEKEISQDIKPPFTLEQQQTTPLIFSSNIDKDIAKSLVGKSVIKMAFSFVQSDYNLSFNTDGSSLGNVSPSIVHVFDSQDIHPQYKINDDLTQVIIKDIFGEYTVNANPDKTVGAYIAKWNEEPKPDFTQINNDKTFICSFSNLYDITVDLEYGEITSSKQPDPSWKRIDNTYVKSIQYGTSFQQLKEEWNGIELYESTPNPAISKNFNWPSGTVSKKESIKPVWITEALVTIDLGPNGEIFSGQAPAGWNFDSTKNIYTKNYPIDTEISTIKSEWTSVVFTDKTTGKNANTLIWPQIEKIRGDVTAFPDWKDVVIVTTYLDGGNTPSKVPEGWEYNTSKKAYWKYYMVGTKIADISNEWKGMDITKQIGNEEYYIAHNFDWPKEESVSQSINVNPLWIRQYKVALLFEGGELGDIPEGWNLESIWDEDTKEYQLGASKLFDKGTKKNDITSDWEDEKYHPHKYGMILDGWTWDEQDANFEVHGPHIFKAVYKDMDPVPVSLDLSNGGGLSGSIPAGWVWDSDSSCYIGKFKIGTKVEDIVNVWTGQVLKHYGYVLDGFTVYQGKTEYENEIIEEDVKSLTIKPTWNPIDDVDIEGHVVDGDGIRLPAETYSVRYLDATGEIITPKSEGKYKISLNYETGQFTCKLPAGSSGVFQFVDLEEPGKSGKKISQDLSINNIIPKEDKTPIDVGNLIVEYGLTISGKVTLPGSEEIFSDSTIVLYSFVEEDGVLKQEKFATATDANGEYSIDVKINRQYFVSAESYNKEGSTRYSTSTSITVYRSNAVCNLEFAEQMYPVTINLNKGLLVNPLDIPVGYAKSGDYKYTKMYCRGTDINVILNVWKSMSIKYDTTDVTKEPPTITSWDIDKSVYNYVYDETTITANWNDYTIISGAVQNTFGIILANADVTIKIDGKSDLTTKTDVNGQYSVQIPIGSSGKVSVSYNKNEETLYAADREFNNVRMNTNVGISYIEQTVSIKGNIKYKGAAFAGKTIEAFTSRNHDGVIERESYYCTTDKNGNYECKVAHQHVYIIQLSLPIEGETTELWYSGDIDVDIEDVIFNIDIADVTPIKITVNLAGGTLNQLFDKSWTKSYNDKNEVIYTRLSTPNSTTAKSIINQWNIAGISCPLDDQDEEQMLDDWLVSPAVDPETGYMTQDTKFTAKYKKLEDDVAVSFGSAETDPLKGTVSTFPWLTKVPSGSTYEIFDGGNIRITYRDKMTSVVVSVSPGIDASGTYYQYEKWTKDGEDQQLPSKGTISGESFNIKCHFSKIPNVTGCEFVVDSSQAEEQGCGISWGDKPWPEADGVPYGTKYRADGDKLIFSKNSNDEIYTATAIPDTSQNYRFTGWKVEGSNKQLVNVASTNQILTTNIKFYASFAEKEKLHVSYKFEDDNSHGYFYVHEIPTNETDLEENSYEAKKKVDYIKTYSESQAAGAVFHDIEALGHDYDNEEMNFELRLWKYTVTLSSGGIETGETVGSTINPTEVLKLKDTPERYVGATVEFVAYMAAPKAIYVKSNRTMLFVYNDIDGYDDNEVYRYAVKKDCNVDIENLDDSNLPNWLYSGDGTPKCWPERVVFDESFKEVHGITSLAGWFMNTGQDSSDEEYELYQPGDQSIDPSAIKPVVDPSGQSNQSDASGAKAIRARQIVSIEGWENFDAGSLNDTSYMLASWNCRDAALTDFSFVQKWIDSGLAIGQITKADYMFGGSLYAKQIAFPLNFFNNATVEGMFYKCRSLESLTLSIDFGRPSQSFDNLFYGCWSLYDITIDTQKSEATVFGENVVTCNKMCYRCERLVRFNILSTKNSEVTFGNICEDYTSAFEKCYALLYLGLKLKTQFQTINRELETGQTKTFVDKSKSFNAALCVQSMFAQCKNLMSLDISSFIMIPRNSYDRENSNRIHNIEINGNKTPGYQDMLKNTRCLSELIVSSISIKDGLTEHIRDGLFMKNLIDLGTIEESSYEYGLEAFMWAPAYEDSQIDFKPGEVPPKYCGYNREISYMNLNGRSRLLDKDDSAKWYRTGDIDRLTLRKSAAYAIVDNKEATMTFKYYDHSTPINDLNSNRVAYKVIDTYFNDNYGYMLPTWYNWGTADVQGNREESVHMRFNGSEENSLGSMGGSGRPNKAISYLECRLTQCESYEVIFDESFSNFNVHGMAFWFAADQNGRQPYKFTNPNFGNINTTNVFTTLSLFGGVSEQAISNDKSYWRNGDTYRNATLSRGMVPWWSLDGVDETDELSNNSYKEDDYYEEKTNDNSDVFAQNSNVFVPSYSYVLESIDLSGLGPMFNYTGMFAGAKELKTVTLPSTFTPGFRSVSGNRQYVRDVSLSSMFADCSNLIKINNIEDINIFYSDKLGDNHVTYYANSMFQNCSSIKSLDLTWLWSPIVTENPDWSQDYYPQLENLNGGSGYFNICENCTSLVSVIVSGKFSYADWVGSHTYWSIGQRLGLPDSFDWNDENNFDTVASWYVNSDDRGPWYRSDYYEGEFVIPMDELNPQVSIDTYNIYRKEIPHATINIESNNTELGTVSTNHFDCQSEGFKLTLSSNEDLGNNSIITLVNGDSDIASGLKVLPQPSQNGKFEYWRITIDGVPTMLDDRYAGSGLNAFGRSTFHEITLTAYFSDNRYTAKAVYGTTDVGNGLEQSLTFYYDDKDHSDEGIVFPVPVDSFFEGVIVRQSHHAELSNSLSDGPLGKEASHVGGGSTYQLSLPAWFEIEGLSDMQDSSAADKILEGILTFGQGSPAMSDFSGDAIDLSINYIKTKVDGAKNVIFDDSFKNFTQLSSISAWFMADSYGNQPFENFYSADADGENPTYTNNLSNLPTEYIYEYKNAFGGIFNTHFRYSSSTILPLGSSFGSSVKNVDFSYNKFRQGVYLDAMFANCASLQKVTFPNVSENEKVSVKEAAFTFANCESLTSSGIINFNKFDMINVSYVNGLYFGCSHLEEVDFSGYNTLYTDPWGDIVSTLATPDAMLMDCVNLKKITFDDKWMANLVYDCRLGDYDGCLWAWEDHPEEGTFNAWNIVYWDWVDGEYKSQRYGTFTREIPKESTISLEADEGGTIDGEKELNYTFMNTVRVRSDQNDTSILWIDNHRIQAIAEEGKKFKYWKFENGFEEELNNTVVPLVFDETYPWSGDDYKIKAVFDDEQEKLQVIFSVDDSNIGTFKFVYANADNINRMLKASSGGGSGSRTINVYDVDDNCSIDNLPAWYYPKTASWFEGETREIPAFKKEIERNCSRINVVFDSSAADYDGLRSTSCWFMPTISNISEDKFYNPFISIDNGKKVLSIDFDNLNFENVQNVSCMFGGYEYFNDNHGSDVNKIELYNFDSRNELLGMGGLFQNCPNLEYVSLNDCGLSNVTDASYLFSNCPSFVSSGNHDNFLETVAQFDFSKITDMSYMFSGLYNNNNVINDTLTVDFSSLQYKTDSLTNMEGMFSGNSHFKSIQIENSSSLIFDTSKVTNMSRMFENCYNVTSIACFPYGSMRALNTQNVKNMSKMFYNCKNLMGTTDDFERNSTPSIWHTLSYDSATDISYMFAKCSSFQNVEFKKVVNPTSLEDNVVVENAQYPFDETFLTYINFDNMYFNPRYTNGFDTIMKSSDPDFISKNPQYYYPNTRDENYGGYMRLDKAYFGPVYYVYYGLVEMGMSSYTYVPPFYSDEDPYPEKRWVRHETDDNNELDLWETMSNYYEPNVPYSGDYEGGGKPGLYEATERSYDFHGQDGTEGGGWKSNIYVEDENGIEKLNFTGDSSECQTLWLPKIVSSYAFYRSDTTEDYTTLRWDLFFGGSNPYSYYITISNSAELSCTFTPSDESRDYYNVVSSKSIYQTNYISRNVIYNGSINDMRIRGYDFYPRISFSSSK